MSGLREIDCGRCARRNLLVRRLRLARDNRTLRRPTGQIARFFFESDVKNFVRANRYRLAALKDEAFSFVQRVAKNFPEEQIIISFSGGKDSSVVADIVARALSNPSLVHIFGNTTLEFPMTLAYAARYRENHPLAIFQTAINDEQNFYSVCEEIGAPARLMRWCASTIASKVTPNQLKFANKQ